MWRRTCCWWWQWDEKRGEGKWTKPSRQPSGRFARSNMATTWSTFEECWQQVIVGRADGVGYMMLGTPCGVLTAIDLDDVIDPVTGETAPWGRDTVARAGSYTERTPSGVGLRILGTAAIETIHRGKKPHP